MIQTLGHKLNAGYLSIIAGVLAFVPLPAGAEDAMHDALHEEVDTDMGITEHADHGEAMAHDTGHAEGGLPQLDFSTYSAQIFWLIVIFAFLYVILAKKSLPDISSTIENRKNHIDSDLSTAEGLQAEAESVQHAYEESLKSAREKAMETQGEMEQSIKSKSAAELDAFQKRADKEIKDIEARLERAKADAMENMNDIASEVAADAVQKIIGVNPDAQQAKQVVQSLTQKAKAA